MFNTHSVGGYYPALLALLFSFKLCLFCLYFSSLSPPVTIGYHSPHGPCQWETTSHCCRFSVWYVIRLINVYVWIIWCLPAILYFNNSVQIYLLKPQCVQMSLHWGALLVLLTQSTVVIEAGRPVWIEEVQGGITAAEAVVVAFHETMRIKSVDVLPFLETNTNTSCHYRNVIASICPYSVICGSCAVSGIQWCCHYMETLSALFLLYDANHTYPVYHSRLLHRHRGNHTALPKRQYWTLCVDGCYNITSKWGNKDTTMRKTGPIFCPLLAISSGCAETIKRQVTPVTGPVIGWG